MVRGAEAEEVGGYAGRVTVRGRGADAQAGEKLARCSCRGRLPDDMKEEGLVGSVCGAAFGRGEFVEERHTAGRTGCT